MIKDLNKQIDLIDYNYMNLPVKIDLINYNNYNTIYYLYDATGNKLRKQTETNGAIVATTDYFGNFVYEDNELKYILTTEGRIVPTEKGEFDYQYFIKDHLGNTRVLFNNDGILQADSYYPFGMDMDGIFLELVNPGDNYYKY